MRQTKFLLPMSFNLNIVLDILVLKVFHMIMFFWEPRLSLFLCLWRGLVPKGNGFLGKHFADPTIK